MAVLDFNSLYASGGLTPVGAGAQGTYNINTTPVNNQILGGIQSGGLTSPGFNLVNPTQTTQPRVGGGNGQVLGTSADNSGTPTSNGPSIEDIFNSDYGARLSELDRMIEQDLPTQSGALITQAEKANQQQAEKLSLQKTEGEQELNTYQSKTLRDLSANLRNLFQSGNTRLGAMGAGDSSAANQYAYGLTKFGTQQRTNVMTDVSNRVTKLKNIFDSEMRNLASSLDQRKAEIAQWFSEQQMALRGQKSSVIQERSRAALDIALQKLSFAQQQAANQKSILDQWVANHSDNINQVIAQMQKNNQNVATPQAFPGMSFGATTPQAYVPGGASNTEENQNLFGWNV